MKLIDILVQELPKRGGWPEGAVHAWADRGGEVRFRKGGCGPDFYPTLSVDFECRISDTHQEDDPRYIVTREQYETALKQSVWDGTGLPPVGCRIEYTCKQFSSHKPSIEEGCWYGGTIIAYHDGFVWTSDNGLRPLDNTLFRPLRTEAERAIDEMVRLSGVSTGAAKILYYSGYRK